jgi:hypothetical protein
MSLRSCRVSFTDSRGVIHGVEVAAESLFEAAVLGLQILKSDAWSAEIGPASRLEVEVREPITKHTVTLLQIERWVNGATFSPNEKVKRERLKAMLAR